MKWSIKQIQEQQGIPLRFSENVDVTTSLKERESEIIDASTVELNGTLLYDNESVLAEFTLNVTVIMPSSRNLEPVAVKLSIPVLERYVEENMVSSYIEFYPTEVILPLMNSYQIDLRESVIDNILLSLPIQVLSEEQLASEDLPSGSGWTMYTEESYDRHKKEEAKNQIDPRFSELQSLKIDED